MGMNETRKFAVDVIEGVIGKLPSIPWENLSEDDIRKLYLSASELDTRRKGILK